MNKSVMNPLLSKSFPVAERVERLSKTLLGQDVIYNMSNGKIKTIKHVQLGIIVKQDLDSCWIPSIALTTQFLMIK